MQIGRTISLILREKLGLIWGEPISISIMKRGQKGQKWQAGKVGDLTINQGNNKGFLA